MTLPLRPADDPCPDHGGSASPSGTAAPMPDATTAWTSAAGLAARNTSLKTRCKPDNRRRAAGIPDKTRRPAQSPETRRKGRIG